MGGFLAKENMDSNYTWATRDTGTWKIRSENWKWNEYQHAAGWVPQLSFPFSQKLQPEVYTQLEMWRIMCLEESSLLEEKADGCWHSGTPAIELAHHPSWRGVEQSRGPARVQPVSSTGCVFSGLAVQERTKRTSRLGWLHAEVHPCTGWGRKSSLSTDNNRGVLQGKGAIEMKGVHLGQRENCN